MKLIDNARHAWKMFSVQAMALAGAIQAAWIAIPADLQHQVPDNIVKGVTLALLALGVAGRLVKQDAIHEDKPSGS